jgi:hypothetical protein
MITEHGLLLEISSLVVGGATAMMVLWTGRNRGIGPQIRLTVALCFIAPSCCNSGVGKDFVFRNHRSFNWRYHRRWRPLQNQQRQMKIQNA